MSKIDFKKAYKELYAPPKKFVTVDVPEMQFLMVDGHGDPNVTQEYQDAVEALYAMAYKIKFSSKKQMGRDYVVPPLEGLWWAEDMETFTTARDKSQWDWTMMIMTPEWITAEIFAETIQLVRKGKNPVALGKVRLETYHEGYSGLMLVRVRQFLDLQELGLADKTIDVNTKGMCCQLGIQTCAKAQKCMGMIPFNMELF